MDEEVWMIQPKFESKFCLYRNKFTKTCMAQGNGGGDCIRKLCPCKVPRNAVEYAGTLDWGENDS